MIYSMLRPASEMFEKAKEKAEELKEAELQEEQIRRQKEAEELHRKIEKNLKSLSEHIDLAVKSGLMSAEYQIKDNTENFDVAQVLEEELRAQGYLVASTQKALDRDGSTTSGALSCLIMHISWASARPTQGGAHKV